VECADSPEALRVAVFTTLIDSEREEDVQWVFIKGLRLRDGHLIVPSEGGKVYNVDLKTKAVTESE
jgi:hypothetical protein